MANTEHIKIYVHVKFEKQRTKKVTTQKKKQIEQKIQHFLREIQR